MNPSTPPGSTEGEKVKHTATPWKAIVVRKDNRVVGFFDANSYKVRKETITWYDENGRTIEKVLEDSEEWFMKKAAPGHELAIESIYIESQVSKAVNNHEELVKALEDFTLLAEHPDIAKNLGITKGTCFHKAKSALNKSK